MKHFATLNRQPVKALWAALLATGALLAPSSWSAARAAGSASTTVKLQMDNFAAITATTAVSIVPTQADFEANQVSVPGAIALLLTTNDIKGATVMLSNSASPTIRSGDLQFRVGAKGDFAAPTTVASPIINHPTNAPDGAAYALDLRVKNLRSYAGGTAGEKAVYTDTLTFTVVPN